MVALVLSLRKKVYSSRGESIRSDITIHMCGSSCKSLFVSFSRLCFLFFTSCPHCRVNVKKYMYRESKRKIMRQIKRIEMNCHTKKLYVVQSGLKDSPHMNKLGVREKLICFSYIYCNTAKVQ